MLESSITIKINQMEQRFPIFYAGSAQLFNSLQECKIKETLSLPHPCIIHQPIEFLPIAKKQYLEPIVTIIVLNESQGELIIKGNLQLAQPGNTIYVYYPYELQVDEFVYKQANSTYDSIIKEVPRGMRDHFCKYLEWKDGKGDHSIQAHVNKLTALIEKETKIQIEKRVQLLLAEIGGNDPEPITYQKLYKQWSSRTKLCILYSHLNLFSLVQPILQTQYALIKTHLSQLPFPDCNIMNSLNPVNQDFDSFFIKMERKELDKLQIITQIYLLTLNHLIQTLKLSEALNLMKHTLMFAIEEVFDKQGDISVQICNKLWEIQIVEITLKELIKQKGLTISGKAELESQIVEYKVYVRKSVQWAGRILLGFSPSIYSLKPKQEQINSLLLELNGEQAGQSRKTPEPNNSLLQSLSPQLNSILSPDLRAGLTSFKDFISMQASTISKTISFLKQTKFHRFELQLQIQIYLLCIYYLDISKEVISDVHKHQKIPSQFPTWTDLSFVHKIYFCRTLLKIQDIPLLCQKLIQLSDNTVLENNQRNRILKYVNTNTTEQKRYKRQIGEVEQVKVIKNQGDRNTVLVGIRLDWGVEASKIILKFMDSKKKEIVHESTAVHVFQKGVNKKEIEIRVEEGNHLFLKSFSIYVGIICYEVSTAGIRERKIQLETVEIQTKWPFGEEISYIHVYTPIQYIIKGGEQSQKLVFQWSSQLELSKIGWVDGHQIAIQNLTQIDLSGKQDHVIEIFIAPFHKRGCIYAAIDLRVGNYTLKDDYAIKFKSPITANLRLQNRFIQYKMVNTAGSTLHIKTEKGRQYQLQKEQELQLLNKKVFVGLVPHSLIEVDLDQFCQEKMEINMSQDKFSIRLETEDLKLFEIIRFKSEIAGSIRILARDGYEVVGKVKGQVGYKNKEEQLLEVGIVPVRTGKIILPDVEIDNKRGEWKHPLILDVRE